MASHPALDKHPDLDEWISIDADGRVTVHSGKVEIGQRISTALALIAAEELDVDFHRVEIKGADTDVSPNLGYTSASDSLQVAGQAIRLASATAKRHLLRRAAAFLEVDLESLEVADGLIRSRDTNQSTTYWELMGGQEFGVRVDESIVPKPACDYSQVGRPVSALDLAGLVDGSAHFIHDTTMPGLLHARVVRPPHYHARLSDLDDTIEARLEGGQLVRDGSFLAVAADDEYLCVKLAARVANAARWQSSRGIETGDLYAALRNNQRVSLPVRDGTAVEEPVPPLTPPPDSARTTCEGYVERPYLMHASIGPSAAVALYESGTLTIWTHTQGVHPLRITIAEALGMNADDVRLVHQRGSGCYGHNGADDAAMDAALVARAIPGRPVLLKWSREDEHAWEPYGSCMVVEIRASIDEQARIVDWCHETYSDTHRTRPRPGPGRVGPSRLLASRFLEDPIPPQLPDLALAAPAAGIHRNAHPYYRLPGPRVVKHMVRDMPLRTSTLRSLGAYANVLAIESMMDELAAAAQIDPLDFRLSHLDDERATQVLEAAAERAGWRQRAEGSGRGHGIAFARYNNLKTYAAVVVELEVTDAAEVRLLHVVIAADAGQVVDAEGLSLQLEGGFLQSASWTLYEEVRFDASGITSRDWDGYPILRFDNVPTIDVVLMDRPDYPYLGPSEAAVSPGAAAIANAIFNATGIRPRRLPFTPDNIRAAALA